MSFCVQVQKVSGRVGEKYILRMNTFVRDGAFQFSEGGVRKAVHKGGVTWLLAMNKLQTSSSGSLCCHEEIEALY